jgi:hypothetical protein
MWKRTTPLSHGLLIVQVYNFSSYKHRFFMPSPEIEGNVPMFWSINIDAVHLVGINTENEENGAQVTNQEIEVR